MQRSSLCWPESPFLEYRTLPVPALAAEHARSVHLNQRIGFGWFWFFFTEMCISDSLVSLPVFTLIFTHSCVPVAGLLWSNVASMNYWSQTAIVKPWDAVEYYRVKLSVQRPGISDLNTKSLLSL